MVLQRSDRLRPDLILFYLPWLAALPLVCAAIAYLEQRAKTANGRIKRLWLSVAVTWMGTILWFIVLRRIDHPELILRRPIPVIFHLPWLATLILVGAAGAYLARMRGCAPQDTSCGGDFSGPASRHRAATASSLALCRRIPLGAHFLRYRRRKLGSSPWAGPAVRCSAFPAARIRKPVPFANGCDALDSLAGVSQE